MKKKVLQLTCSWINIFREMKIKRWKINYKYLENSIKLNDKPNSFVMVRLLIHEAANKINFYYFNIDKSKMNWITKIKLRDWCAIYLVKTSLQQHFFTFISNNAISYWFEIVMNDLNIKTQLVWAFLWHFIVFFIVYICE